MMMGKIITNSQAMRLIKDGEAICVGHTQTECDMGGKYAIINRYDEQRTDHTPDDGGKFDALLGS